jgi:hypothetical protein
MGEHRSTEHRALWTLEQYINKEEEEGGAKRIRRSREHPKTLQHWSFNLANFYFLLSYL